jgi:hypothetical protein
MVADREKWSQAGKISRSDRENLSVVNGAAALMLNLRGSKTK